MYCGFFLSDRIDDDYLYAWYRTLYSLFHKANFRLYHTATSNQLCLQVTLMESCMYSMSWVKSPSPRTFIMYPPAVDGKESASLLDPLFSFSHPFCLPLSSLSLSLSLSLKRKVQ